jgi:hypothetical protein
VFPVVKCIDVRFTYNSGSKPHLPSFPECRFSKV